MEDNKINLYLQIINIILTFLSPLVFSAAYLIRKVHKSRCCKSSVTFDNEKGND